MPLNLDYEKLLPLAIDSIYSDAESKTVALSLLEKYGASEYHREIPRVRLGILYLTSKSPDRLPHLVALACSDYRDLLCAAEYPHSSRRFGLKEKAPDKYHSLQEKESREYMAWIAKITDMS
jgi:hypothetical protein